MVQVLNGRPEEFMPGHRYYIPGFQPIPGGREPSGETQYICLGDYKGEWHWGKWFESSKRCNIEYSYKEVELNWDPPGDYDARAVRLYTMP